MFDEKLTFDEHMNTVSIKISKTINLLRKLQNLLPRSALITLYKSFIRPHLDYGDVIYDEAYNSTFHQKLETIQYNACLAITGAIKGTSKEKLYHELGLETLQLRRWYRKMCYFYKFYILKQPGYLFNLISTRTSNYSTRNTNNIPLFNIKHNFFKNSFFPSAVIEWNKLDPNLRNATTYANFRKGILSFIRPKPNSVYNCNNPKGLKLITRLRLGLSHLREHKFKHNFQDCINPLCSCGSDVESIAHYFLHCPFYVNERHTLLKTINDIDRRLMDNTESNQVQYLLFGDTSKDADTNTDILNATMKYVLSTKRFDESLL